ncbi:hypothetical protein [Parendozoicomonas sp. Alg238-R29]|uniref:CAF17-like 4Fe-4S cluster assembly/insertion protein YgfZ n=1 Tax=Parendozoicomonas sp. Alg238-R29 TaxID=2993446 RepID=UPI00248ED5E6|nr:hypothetical protein [Parendozoicomonas sp. Alg238-R29]
MTSNEWHTWLESQNIAVSHGMITSASASSTEEPWLTLLGHQLLLTFSGKENRKFLQGQLTCDVEKLKNNQTTLGACCTPKGRMVANFRIVAHNDDLIFSLPADQSDVLHEHLKKYAMFFRTVSIHPQNDKWVRLGLGGKKASELLIELFGQIPETGTIAENDYGMAFSVFEFSQRYELWIKPDRIQQVWEKLSAKATVVSTAAWQLSDIKDGIAWVTEASRDAWIPQHLNWQAVDGVSFKKGCYTGQEIVARMKYLGKLKSRLYRFTLEGQDLPAIGSIVNNQAGNKTGDIVATIQSADKSHIELLAVVRKADTEAELTLADTGTKLQLQNIPYSVED